MPQGTRIGSGYIAVSVDESGARAALGAFVRFAGGAFTKVAATGALVTGAAAKMGIGFLAMREQASIAFTTLLGSGQKAESFLVDLQQFAAKTPFELPGLINNARQLLGVGVAAKNVIPTLTSLGNAAGALGIDQERFNNILLATTQAMGKGKLQGEELMQMVENGIPVWQLLSKATGKSVGELQKLSSAGKLNAQETLPKLFAQMQKDYGGAMIAQSGTLIGQWSSLKDNTQILLGTAFKPLFNETKKLTGAMGDLVGSDRANQWAVSFATGLERGLDAATTFGSRLKEEFGPTVSDALDDAKRRFSDLWPSIKDGAASALGTLGTIAGKALPPLLDLAQAGGGLLKTALESLDKVLDAVERNADEIADGVATAAHVAAAVAAPAFQLFGLGLQLAAHVLTLLVDLIGDLSGPLGVVTGLAIGGAAAWRLFGGTLGGIPGALRSIKPSEVAQKLQPLADKISSVAERAGVMTWQLTGSASAGHKVVTAGKAAGSALTKVGSALPVVGVAAVGLGLAFEQVAQRSQAAADAQEATATALLKGGKAADDARRQLEGLRDVATGESWLSSGAQNAIDNITGSVKQQRAEMSELERAQANASAAQRDYDNAVAEFGPNSAQATSAHYALRDAAVQVNNAERGAAEATKSHEDALLDLANQALAAANADVALRQANLQVQTAEKAAADAVRAHGKNSNEARNANLQLEQAYINAANAAVLKAQKDNAGKSASEQAAAATKAYNGKILEMVNAAGVKAPSSLLRLVDGLSDSELAAYNAAMQTSGFKTQVVSLPSGRTVRVVANTAQAKSALDVVRDKLASIRNKVVDVHVNLSGNAQAAAHLPTGGFQRRATGGPLSPNVPTLVGEEGPELITPNSGGYVHNAKATADILAGARSGGGAGTAVTQNLYQMPGENLDQLADRVATKLAWRIT